MFLSFELFFFLEYNSDGFKGWGFRGIYRIVERGGVGG